MSNLILNRIGVVDQIQELEDTLFDLLLNRSLNTATGVQLDKLGAIVDESRQGRSDDDYRLFIGVKITRNLSEGVPETLIQVLSSLTGSTSVELHELFPATVQLDFDGTPAGSLSDLLNIMDGIAAGGVKVILNSVEPGDVGFKYSASNVAASDSDNGYGADGETDIGGEYAALL